MNVLEEKDKTNQLHIRLRKSEQEKQTKVTVNIKIEINEIEYTEHRVNNTKSWFIQMINKIDEP